MSMTLATRDDVRSVIRDILADLLDNEAVEISDETAAGDVAGWDSIVQVKLLLAIEAEMDFRLATEEAEGLLNVGALVDLIQRKTRA
jgi:acyl carrier protein